MFRVRKYMKNDKKQKFKHQYADVYWNTNYKNIQSNNIIKYTLKPQYKNKHPNIDIQK